MLLGLPHYSSCGKHVFFVGCFSSCPHCLSLLNDGHVAKADTLAAGWARKSLSQTWSSGVVQDGDLNTMPSPTLPQPSGSISLVYYCFTNIWVGFIGKSISIGRQRGLFQCQIERFEVSATSVWRSKISKVPPLFTYKKWGEQFTVDKNSPKIRQEKGTTTDYFEDNFIFYLFGHLTLPEIRSCLVQPFLGSFVVAGGYDLEEVHIP